MALEKEIQDAITKEYLPLKSIKALLNSKEPEAIYKAKLKAGDYFHNDPQIFLNKPDSFVYLLLLEGIREDKERGIKGKRGLNELDKYLTDYVSANTDKVLAEISTKNLFSYLVNLPQLKDEKYKDITKMLTIAKALSGAYGNVKYQRFLLQDFFEKQPYLSYYGRHGLDEEVEKIYGEWNESLTKYYNKKINEIGEARLREYAKEVFNQLKPEDKIEIFPDILTLAVIGKENAKQ